LVRRARLIFYQDTIRTNVEIELRHDGPSGRNASSTNGFATHDPDRRRAAQLPRPEGLRDGAARLIKSKNPHSMVEVKDLQSGDVTALAASARGVG
jgi:hypothetical protein